MLGVVVDSFYYCVDIFSLRRSMLVNLLDCDCLLSNLRLSPEGQLDDEALKLAAILPIPHAVTVAVEDEQGLEDMETSNTPPLFLYSEERLCTCSLCQTRLCKTESLATCVPVNL